MAQVRLRRYEITEKLLPPVCLKCGAQAEVTKAKTFSWHPPWVGFLILMGLLPYAIVAICLTKRMKVYALLCHQHQRHWLWRALYIYLGLVFFLVLGCGGIFLLTSMEQRRGANNDFAGFFFLVTLLAFLAWFISVIIVQHLAIRPTEITDRDITLTNVSPYFADAVEEERYNRRQEERRPRRRRLEREYDDADEGRPGRERDSYDDADQAIRDEDAYRRPRRRYAEDDDEWEER